MQGDRKRRCPLVQDPLKDCFCFEMDSRKVEKAMHYCGGNFEQCEIYNKQFASGMELIVDAGEIKFRRNIGLCVFGEKTNS